MTLEVHVGPYRKPNPPRPAESGRGLLLFATLAGGLIGFLSAPTIRFSSYAAAQYLWALECTTSGAVAGAAAGLLIVVIWQRFRFSVALLLEMVIVTAILAGLCRNVFLAKWRSEDSERRTLEELHPSGN
jgi:hypothetical protein